MGWLQGKATYNREEVKGLKTQGTCLRETSLEMELGMGTEDGYGGGPPSASFPNRSSGNFTGKQSFSEEDFQEGVEEENEHIIDPTGADYENEHIMDPTDTYPNNENSNDNKTVILVSIASSATSVIVILGELKLMEPL